MSGERDGDAECWSGHDHEATPTMERSAGRDPDLDRLAEVVARMIEVPIVLISTIESGLQRFPGAVGLAPALATSRATDELLRAAARALRATFRDSDTLGRLGGDELGVFSVAATMPDLAAIEERLDAEVAHINRDRDGALPLRWSTGAVAFDIESSASLDTLLAEADRRVYENKRRRVGVSAVP